MATQKQLTSKEAIGSPFRKLADKLWKNINAAEINEELIKLSKRSREIDDEAKQLGLIPYG